MKSVKVQVCFGTHCTMMGAMDIYESITQLRDELNDNQLEIQVVKCFGDCKSNLDAPDFASHPASNCRGPKVCS